ncbi:MAG: NADH dehydrogenase [Actinobacteria bacterium]|nr:NADH dehydrogenase [Actinomycetota bacterium]
MTALVALSLLVPIVAGTALALANVAERRRAAAVVAVGAALASLVLLAVVLARTGRGRTVVWWGDWPPRGRVVGIDFAIDGLGAGLALYVMVLALPALLMAGYAIRASAQLFYGVCLVFVAAMVGYCLTGDLFDLFVFFELMSVAAYVLVGYEVRQRAPLEGALTFAITNGVGSILLLFGIALLYGKTGALNLAQIGRALHEVGPSGLVYVAFALVATGLLVKAAVVPFHFWTADAYGVAPTPVLILLAGVFSELGLYGFARVFWTVFEPALAAHHDAVRAIFVVLGVATGLLGAALALAQHHLRRMLAFVVVSQIGLFLVGIALLSADGLAGTAIFVVGDGFAKAALFICVGVVQHRYDAIEERTLHGRARALRPLAVVYLIAALTVADLPPFGTFLGKALVEDAALSAPGWAWVPAVMALISALAAGALLRAGLRVFGGVGEPAPRDERFAPREEDAARSDEADVAVGVPAAIAAVLVLAALVWGLVPGLAQAVTDAAARFIDPAGYAAAVLGGGVGASTPAVPAVRGPGVTAYLYAAATLAGAAAVAALGVAGRRLPAAAARAVDAVRALHSGHAGDYVAWTAGGAAALAGLFALTLR